MAQRLDDDLILAAVEHAAEAPSPHAAVLFLELHGAYGRVSKTGTAYCHRDKQYEVMVMSAWDNPQDTSLNVAWVYDLFNKWRPHLAEAAYVNDLGDEGDERVRSAYGENYARLVVLKDKYDPTNFFRLNQNIRRGVDVPRTLRRATTPVPIRTPTHPASEAASVRPQQPWQHHNKP